MHKQKDRRKLRIGERGDELTAAHRTEPRGEWERNNSYMNFGPNRVVWIPQSTTRLGPKLVRVLGIATRRTHSGFKLLG
jgi:hypothetical protein